MLESVYRLSFFVFLNVAFESSIYAFPEQVIELIPARSIDQLEQRLVRIDHSLENLASFSTRGGFGAIGISSQQYNTFQQSVWFEIDLEELTPIDQVVIVPTLGQGANTGIRADGFPVKFNVLAGTGDDPKGTVIASFDESDNLLPRFAPLVIDCSMHASWVKIEASQLSRHVVNDRYILKLAEVLVFNGSENVALRRPVKTSSGFIRDRFAQNPEYVTDGFLPYLMDSAHGSRSKPVISAGRMTEPYILSMDLGEAVSLTHINLHALYSNYSIPLYTSADEGIPRHWMLEGALTEDFSDAVELANVQYRSFFDVGPILRYRTKSHPSRYVRFREVMPSFALSNEQNRRAIGFDEMELISEGENVATGKVFSCNFELVNKGSMHRLTDGKNFYGEIIPLRRWVNELAEGHDLMNERLEINTNLSLLYERQQVRLTWMRRVAFSLGLGVLIVILVSRMIGLRRTIQLRERIAADLHDNLSANLHAVALLGDIAKQNIDRKAKLAETLDKIQDLSRHSRHATRHCMNMLQAETVCDDLIVEMQNTSERLLSEFDHQLSVVGVEWIEQLSARKRLDLSLFYKECLINILRHSNASICRTNLHGTPDGICLEVSDNGQEISEVPPSLTRRSELLGARLNIQPTKGEGNYILLEIETKRFPYLFRKQSRRVTPSLDVKTSNDGSSDNLMNTETLDSPH